MEYAGYVEFGTYKMAPRAFMRPAADVNEPKFYAAMDALAAHL
jgi:HK97 gp10 family phage protein